MFNRKAVLCEVWKCQLAHIPYSLSTLLKASLPPDFIVSPLQYVITANRFCTTFSVGQIKSNAPGQTHSVGFLLSQTVFWFGRSNQRRYASLFFNCNSLSLDHNISRHSFFLRKSVAPGQVRTADFSITCTVYMWDAGTN